MYLNILSSELEGDQIGNATKTISDGFFLAGLSAVGTHNPQL
jgi:hypothetical protein